MSARLYSMETVRLTRRNGLATLGSSPIRRYRLGVRTRGSQPRDRGSNPRTGTNLRSPEPCASYGWQAKRAHATNTRRLSNIPPSAKVDRHGPNPLVNGWQASDLTPPTCEGGR